MRFIPKKRAVSSILGLALDGSRLEGVVVRRTNGSLHIVKSFAFSLALNPMTSDPELIGREIRNQLDQAGIRERHCAMCVPLSLALTVQAKIPELPDSDVASFLEIEAERGFPYGPDTLSLCQSRYQFADSGQLATLVAIPRNHLAHLEKALRAARLKPMSFTLGVVALQTADTDASQGVLALSIRENSVDVQVTCGGGIAALRALEGVIETEAGQKRLDADLLAREIRVTLGQLPVEIRNSVRKARLFGSGDLLQRFENEIAPRLEAMGLRVELEKEYRADAFRGRLPADAVVSPALSLAAKVLTGVQQGFEFLPPRISSWQQLTTRFSSKKLAWVGAMAGSMALLITMAFLVQQWRLSRLESRWLVLQPKVRELEDMQQQIRKYRPWFDESYRSLSILSKLTEAFPQDGVVSAKSVVLRDVSNVSCSGTARDNQALLQMRDRLSATAGVTDVHIEQTRGSSPLQFTFNFQWIPGGAL